MDDDEIARAELTAAATELFEVEDDDDEPIFGRSHDDEDVIDEEEDDDADSRRRGRRRRRRGRGNERTAGEDDLPTYTVSDASDVVIRTDDDSEASADEPRAREPRRDNRREEGRDERRDNRRDNRRDRDDRRDRPRANGGEPAQVGRELADEVEGWLVAFQRQGGATVQKLAEQAGGRSNGGEHVIAHIVACCRADNLRLEAEGRRPRFRFVSNNRIALSEWALDRELSRLEKDMFAAIDRYRDTLRSRLAKRISELPHKAFTEFAYLVLERAGYKSLSVVKRPGAHTSELHLSGVLAAGGSETPVAIVIRKDGRDIGRERVTELRGSLHHYGVCSLGVLVTAGQILSGARDEAAVAGATPVTFLDGMTIAGLCEQYGIATVTQHLKLAVPDQDLFDAMRHSH